MFAGAGPTWEAAPVSTAEVPPKLGAVTRTWGGLWSTAEGLALVDEGSTGIIAAVLGELTRLMAATGIANKLG